MNGAGVGSTFIVQLPVQAGGKVEPQIMTNRAHSVTFGSDAEVICPPIPLLPLLPLQLLRIVPVSVAMFGTHLCGVSPWNTDEVIVDVAAHAPSHMTLYCWLCGGTQPEQALNIAFQRHPVAAALDVATQAYPSDFVLLPGLRQSASLQYRPSVASCCCCSRRGYCQLAPVLCCGIEPGSGT